MVDGQLCTAAGIILQPGFNSLPVNIGDTVCLGPGDADRLGPGNRILRRDPAVVEGTCHKRQVGATLLGLATGLAYVARSCLCNAENALCNRHGVAAPPFTGDFDRFTSYLHSVSNSVGLLYTDYLSVWTRQWLLKWPKRKQTDITQSTLNDELKPAEVKMMVKREALIKMPTKARGIQYYVNLCTQALFGAEFFSLQKSWTSWFCRRDVGHGVRLTFASGMNATALGEWMREVLASNPNTHFYERDGKNWDSTMQRPHLELRLAAYACAGDDFARFVRAGFDVKGKVPRSGLAYRLRGTVKSGHNDTTLGNSIVNGGIIVEVMWALGLTGDIIITGDDALVAISGDFDEHCFARHEATFGIVPEYRKFTNPMDVSFISGVWFPSSPSHWAFVPKPGRLLARLFWSVRPPSERARQRYLNSIVLGLRPSCQALPVIAAFLDAHFDAAAGTGGVVVDKRLDVWAAGHYQVNPVVLRAAFCSRYGLTDFQVADAEGLLSSCHGLIGLVSHDTLDRIMAVDLADVRDRPLTSSQ